MPVSAMAGKKITTIEGLSPDGSHPVQKAWVQAAGAPCAVTARAAMIMAAADAAQGNPESFRRADQRSDEQHLPLRYVRARSRSDPSRREDGIGDDDETQKFEAAAAISWSVTAAVSGGPHARRGLSGTVQAADAAVLPKSPIGSSSSPTTPC